MIKADDKVEFEGNDPEKFTEFEYLVKKVEVMKDTIDEHAEILRQNDLIKTEKTDAPYVDDDEIFKRLENEE
jgi:hypothetical protein